MKMITIEFQNFSKFVIPCHPEDEVEGFLF
jgi:hypothetical protein